MEYIDTLNHATTATAPETYHLSQSWSQTDDLGEMANTSYEYQFSNHTFTEEDIKQEFQLMLRQYLYELYKKRKREQLYEVPWTLIILLSFIYGSVSVTSFFGNGLVIWVVMVSRKMRTVTNLYIGNLALADIIIGLFSIPFQFQAALLQRWHLPDFMCAFCPFFQVLSVNLSVFTLSAIAMDRHRAVLHPLVSRPSRKVAVVVIVLVWAISLLFAVPTFLDYKVVTSRKLFNPPHPYCRNVGLSPNVRFYYNLSLVGTQYFIPLLIISVAYIRMAVRLWGRTMPGNKEEGRDAIMLQNKKRAVKMLILVVLIFGVCWLPLQTYNFVQYVYPKINNYQYINIIWFCIHWLAMSNSCVNPFIYAIYNEKFQEEFTCRLSCLKICSNVCTKKQNRASNSVLLVLTERPPCENQVLPSPERGHSSLLDHTDKGCSRSPRDSKQKENKSSSNSSTYSYISRSNRSSIRNVDLLKHSSLQKSNGNIASALKLLNKQDSNPSDCNIGTEIFMGDHKNKFKYCSKRSCKLIAEKNKANGRLRATTSLLVRSESSML